MRAENPKRHPIAEMDRCIAFFVTIAWVEGTNGRAFVEELLESRFALITRVFVRLVEPERGPREVCDDVGNSNLTDAGLTALDGCDD
jgi:hypothetical protein